MSKKSPEIPEKIQLLIKKVVDHCKNEDRETRDRQIRMWRQLKLFWEGYQKNWYDEVAHDWRIDDVESGDDSGQAYYDKPVNIFRAYLESIIAALSITVPPVKCYPDDAENTLDLQTAKAGDKVAKLLYRHNDAPLLWLHALFIFCTEGMIAARTYTDTKEEYGTYEVKEHEDVEQTQQSVLCPNCGYQMIDETIDPMIMDRLEAEEYKFAPDDSDVPIQDYIQEEGTEELCPACGQQVIVELQNETFITTRLIGCTNEPKSRIKMEAYGGLYVKVPNYARTQKDCPYLQFSYETHFANAIEDYCKEEYLDADELKKKIRRSRGGITDPYNEELGRLSPQYRGNYPNNVVTVQSSWLRPAIYNVLDEEEIKEMRKHFPNGCKTVFVNDLFAEACNANLDDEWTLTYNPLSDYIHFDPLGLLLVSIQELINDLISLTQQTIEHGIGQTFVDPEVVNMNAYKQVESIPGGLYEAKPKSGRSLGESFYEVKTATLSGEVLPFFQQLQSLGQLVSGALPSLFGGNLEGSGTASEYSMSRAQALQRLQNNWKMLTFWWKSIFGKAIPAYIKEIHEDEKSVERTTNGDFINVFVRRAELDGKIGRVELEANENLPITWNQKKDVIMQLLQSAQPEVLAILGAPENLPIIREAIGLDEFFVPGEDDKEKALDDIKMLLNTEPIMDPMTGMEMPSVDIDETYDNPNIAFEIIRKWVISEAGRQAKTDNQAGYKNVLLFGQGYKMMIDQAAMAQQAMMAQGEDGSAPPNKPKPNGSAPISGEENVSTEQ